VRTCCPCALHRTQCKITLIVSDSSNVNRMVCTSSCCCAGSKTSLWRCHMAAVQLLHVDTYAVDWSCQLLVGSAVVVWSGLCWDSDTHIISLVLWCFGTHSWWQPSVSLVQAYIAACAVGMVRASIAPSYDRAAELHQVQTHRRAQLWCSSGSSEGCGLFQSACCCVVLLCG
jgi:hypothetical protein